MPNYHISDEIKYLKKEAKNFLNSEQIFFVENEKDFLDTEVFSMPNIPLKGYKINFLDDDTFDFLKGEHLPQIIHPNGLEFQISFQNLTEILKHCSIIDGHIQDECILSFQNKHLVLLPMSSPNTQKIYSKINQHIKIKHEINHNNFLGFTFENNLVYLGQHQVKTFFSREIDSYSNISFSEKKLAVFQKIQKYHVFYNFNKGFVFQKNFNPKNCLKNETDIHYHELLRKFHLLNNLKFNIADEPIVDFKNFVVQKLDTQFKNSNNKFTSSNLKNFLFHLFSSFSYKIDDNKYIRINNNLVFSKQIEIYPITNPNFYDDDIKEDTFFVKNFTPYQKNNHKTFLGHNLLENIKLEGLSFEEFKYKFFVNLEQKFDLSNFFYVFFLQNNDKSVIINLFENTCGYYEAFHYLSNYTNPHFIFLKD